MHRPRLPRRSFPKASKAWKAGPTKPFSISRGSRPPLSTAASSVHARHGPERRSVIAQALLLAQVVAIKRTLVPGRVQDWYKDYYDVPSNLGWVIENRGFAPSAARRCIC
jgi:hypothetical protein